MIMGTMMMMEGTVVQSVFDCYSEMTRCDWFFFHYVLTGCVDERVVINGD